MPAVIEHKLGPLVKTKDGQMWRCHVDHLKKVHNAQASEDGEENSNSATDSWELPSTQHSDTHLPEAKESGDASENMGSAAENAAADELPNTVEAEASLGGTHRYPTRVHHPNYFSN